MKELSVILQPNSHLTAHETSTQSYFIKQIISARLALPPLNHIASHIVSQTRDVGQGKFSLNYTKKHINLLSDFVSSRVILCTAICKLPDFINSVYTSNPISLIRVGDYKKQFFPVSVLPRKAAFSSMYTYNRFLISILYIRMCMQRIKEGELCQAARWQGKICSDASSYLKKSDSKSWFVCSSSIHLLCLFPGPCVFSVSLIGSSWFSSLSLFL